MAVSTIINRGNHWVGDVAIRLTLAEPGWLDVRIVV